MNNYGRRHIVENLITLAGGAIHPAYCIGRKAENLNDKEYEIFAQAFFASRSSEELKILWDFAEKESLSGELLLTFSVKDGDHIVALTEKEMKTFDFSRTWEIHSITSTEDELREIEQAICAIVFNSK